MCYYPPTPPSSGVSKIEGPYKSDTIAVAAAQLPAGNVILWSAYNQYDFGGPGGRTWTEIFDPETGTSRETLVVNTHHDMFCPGTAILGDGRIMVTGGNDEEATSFYNPKSSKWSIGPKMKIARGYHSMTPLGNGSVFTIGGSWSGDVGDKEGEVWTESRGWVLKPGIPSKPLLTDDESGYYRADNHMWLFQSPDGRIFHAGPSKQMHWIDIKGNGQIVNSVRRGDDSDAMCGNAAMFDIGKILTVGGSENYDSGKSSNRAYVIDINRNQTSVERVGDMEFGRVFHNSIVLPSGEVVVVGGQTEVLIFSDDYAVLGVELWNPTTKKFRKLESQLTIARNYHSVGLLLKDGRVMVAGGGLCGSGCDANHFDSEILTPPYLLNPDGTMANRPSIKRVFPKVFRPGGRFLVKMDRAGRYTFALIRLGAATHGTNNDQRRIPLKVFKSIGNRFKLSIPWNLSVVLPGTYYLFAMDSKGVPSKAWDVQCSRAT